MCSEIIAFCKNLMLAQAQECMVEKSLLERKRPSLVTKVAWEVSTLYQKAIDLLDSQVCCLFVCFVVYLFFCLLVCLLCRSALKWQRRTRIGRNSYKLNSISTNALLTTVKLSLQKKRLTTDSQSDIYSCPQTTFLLPVRLSRCCNLRSRMQLSI